ALPIWSFPIEVIATAGDAPAGMIVVPPSETDFYAAMLAAFADGVSRKVSDLPKPDPNRLTAD
ncbi:MAG: hypothetical protein GWN08_18815, partial [Gemmatimonadetes bacterium]|nr:hypothetical protein [Gemmatimonadota bacterium]NIW77277.1 hypothetical protein [Gemmatimonadota bacterium]